MAQDNKTEKATPRRRNKAREEGQVARSRELSGALALLTMVITLSWQPMLKMRDEWRTLWVQLLDQACGGQISSVTPLIAATAKVVLHWTIVPLLAVCGMAVLAAVGQGGLVFSGKALTPKMSRLNPGANLGRMFSLSGMSNTLKSLLPLRFLIYLFFGLFTRDWTQMVGSEHATPAGATTWVLGRVLELSWKASLVFLIWSGMDYIMQRSVYERQLRMSKEEVRQESKDTEGNPQIKGRIRRMQRQLRRRFKLKDVARATVVITNPTHYAVALEYRMETMPAPIVIAKGSNLLAQQIKKHALWNDVPIVENKFLAQSLYKSVEVGDKIPEQLYTAVAEILAFIFKAQGRKVPAGAAPNVARRS